MFSDLVLAEGESTVELMGKEVPTIGTAVWGFNLVGEVLGTYLNGDREVLAEFFFAIL